MVDDKLITETINSINTQGLEETLRSLKGKDYELELLEIIALRPSLTWQDQVMIEYELHTRRQTQFGVNQGGRPPVEGKIGWSQNDTAKELKISMGQFSEDLSLARALQSNPHLRTVKDKRTAIKLVRQVAKREIAAVEALRPSKDMDQILLGDSNDILKLFPDQTFDACITDPPWTDWKDAELRADERTFPVFKEIFRVLKRDSFLYAFLSTPDYIAYSKLLPNLGFKIQEYPVVWHKTGSMTHGRAPWQYARDFEPVLLAVKGAPSLTRGTEISSVMTHPIVHTSKVIHPHEKPIDLIKNLVVHCTWEGGKVLDPFGGSGVLAEACKQLDRRYVVIERNPVRFAQIEKRMNGTSTVNKT